MSRVRRHCGAVCALNTSDLAEQHPLVFVDDHHAILPADEQPVIRGIGDDVVPAAVPAERIRMGDPVR